MRGLAEALDADSAWLTAQQVDAGREGRGPARRRPRRRPHAAVLPAGRRGARRLAGRQGGPPDRRLRPCASTASRRATSRSFDGNAPAARRGGIVGQGDAVRGNAAEPHEVTLVREKLPTSQVTSRALANGIGLSCVSRPSDRTPRPRSAAVADSAEAGRDSAHRRRPRARRRDVRRRRSTPRGCSSSGTMTQRELRGAEGRRRCGEGRRRRASRCRSRWSRRNGTSGAGRGLRRGAGRQQPRDDRRRAHARPRGRPEARHGSPDGSGLWMTTARFLDARPASPSTAQGWIPGSRSRNPDVEFGAEPPTTDPILDKAIATPPR